MSQNIAIFDVCGTITKTNNTYDFISFFLKKKSNLRYLYFLIIRIFSVILSLAHLNSKSIDNIIRNKIIHLLKGYSSKELDLIASEYVNFLEKNSLFHKEIIDRIKYEKKKGKKIIIISASIDPPIDKIASLLKIKEYYSSKLGFDNGICTGKLESDLLGNKQTILTSLGKINYKNSSVYTDNLEDIILTKHFGNVYPVVHSDKNKKRWFTDYASHQLNFIELSKSKKINDLDINSVNKSNYKLTYIPSFYYILSRFHFNGLTNLLFKEIIPVLAILVYFSNISLLNSSIIVFLSFLLFFSIYEIGGLYNDLNASNEKINNPTNRNRIEDGVKIKLGLFLFLRFIFTITILLILYLLNLKIFWFILTMSICLLVYIIHTYIKNSFRLFSYSILKVLRNLIPLLAIYQFIPLVNTFFCIFINDAPYRIYFYIKKRKSESNIKPKINLLFYLVNLFIGLILYFMTNFIFYIILPVYFLIFVIVRFFIRLIKIEVLDWDKK